MARHESVGIKLQPNLFDAAPLPKPDARTAFEPETLAEPIALTQDAEQSPLFDKGEWWEQIWKGMPEFVQEDQEPFKTIFVHFETRADMEAFAELVKQRITLNTKSIWYPCAEIGRFAGKSYVVPAEDSSIETFEDE